MRFQRNSVTTPIQQTTPPQDPPDKPTSLDETHDKVPTDDPSKSPND